MKLTKQIILKHPILFIISTSAALLIIINCIKNIILHLTCELQLSYTWDTPIYWAVGRGLLNGLKPYVDLFETKPPGVFLLSALSFSLTNDVFLGNVFSFLCLVIIGFAPIFATYFYLKRNKLSPIYHYSLLFTSFVFGTLLMLYCQVRSGQIQVEGLGATFACLYVLTISFIKVENMKFYSPVIFLSSFFLMSSGMFKEPFVLVAIACSLLFINSFKEFLFKLLLPLVYGGLFGVVILLFSGSFAPYIKIYLPHMLGSHISVYGSPFERGFDFLKLLEDLSGFSLLFSFSIFMLFFNFLFIFAKNLFTKKAISFLVFNIMKLFVIIYLPIFAVGLGGQYYNHHFVFAAPFYFSLFVFFILNFTKGTFPYKKTVLSFLLITLCISSLLLPRYRYDASVLEANPQLRTEAKYVDTLLDAVGEERYQFLGFNGNLFYGFTKHSPLGPVFFQDPNNFMNGENWFSQNLIAQLQKANIVIIDKINVHTLNKTVNAILEENYTEVPYPEAKAIEKPQDFHYKILFRKK